MLELTILNIIFLAIILAISIGLHEYAHAFMSFKLGDPTPKLQNRLTPNPLAHIDPIGFLMIFIAHFGRGKPVEINPIYYKHPLRDELIVSLAGPFTNFVLSIFGILIILAYQRILGNPNVYDMLVSFWGLFSKINVVLAIFNLLPVPPLDGYRLIKFLWPSLGYTMERNMIYFYVILILIIFTVGGGIISDLANIIVNRMYALLSQLFF